MPSVPILGIVRNAWRYDSWPIGGKVRYASAMSTLDDYTLFRFYYLGFDADYEYGFRNLHHAASHFDVAVDDIKRMLADWQLDAAVTKRVDYNLARAHSEAQVLSLEGASIQEREAFSQRAWQEFRQARAAGLSESIIDHLDVVSAFDLPGD